MWTTFSGLWDMEEFIVNNEWMYYLHVVVTTYILLALGPHIMAKWLHCTTKHNVLD